MHIIYRISDNGYKKNKPGYINNHSCFHNFCNIFHNYLANLYIIADNVSGQTLEFLSSKVDYKNIHLVSVGHGAGTFNIALDMALKLPSEAQIYFVENDYLHKPLADKILLEGFGLNFPFITLYDHPDKYLAPELGGNQFCKGSAENTRVYLTSSCHWKITNSTTMTFASTVATLKKYEQILRKWTSSTHPHDFQMFIELMQNQAFLISSIPGYSTHGETEWLSPLADWGSYV
jgi:hypothetical protein